MSKPHNLVIVESPAKAKTIEKFLGEDYRVLSSYGHIRDLKKKSLSIDIEHSFAPEYEIPDDKRTLVEDLKKAAKSADTVWLASDEDREGEAIAWHLYEVLKLKPENTRRIVFHEITKKAILDAIAHPRNIDLARVDAQQARRVLDRIVGFELSPVLWKRIKPALSAGRVQSVAVRLIVEREKEIAKFVSEPYYRVTAIFNTKDEPLPIHAELHRRLATTEEAETFLNSCLGVSKDSTSGTAAHFRTGSVSVKPGTKTPAPPFTTSTLQQEAARRLGFPVSRTMSLAQRLYENGHITYMRTDSLNLSEEALASMAKAISSIYGKEYVKVRRYHTHSKGAQEAHEAIRPTYANVERISGATADEQRLYALIRRRALASQMSDALLERTTVEIVNDVNDAIFTATGEVITFDGFLSMYADPDNEEKTDTDTNRLPHIEKGQPLTATEITATERFTQQPARYTEASLVKKMEELGIGRPSTYAPTISTIQQRGYVTRGEHDGTARSYHILRLSDGVIAKGTKSENAGSNKGKLVPTDIGVVVNDFLVAYFPDILDYNFTARIEKKFDEIADGKLPWTKEIAGFYAIFHPAVDSAGTITEDHKFGERHLGTDPETGRPVSVKIGRFGPVVQIGETNAEEKPRFASLLQGQSVQTITLDEALKLFAFPRKLGEYEGKEVSVAIGRFGPYVRYGDLFASIPKNIQPAEVTLDRAVELITAKREQQASREIKVFAEDAGLRILNGRYGPYLAYGKKNYKLPKSVTVPADITYEQAKSIIEQADKTPAKPRRTVRRTVRRKS